MPNSYGSSISMESEEMHLPGSVLSWGIGHRWWLVYINDLPDELSSQVRLFADDTAVYLTIGGAEDVKLLQNDLDRLSVWEDRWDMEFNPFKCPVVRVTSSINHLTSHTHYMVKSLRLSQAPSTWGWTFQLVRPQLEYAAPVWDPHTKEKVLQLEKVQHRAAHCTTSSFDYRSSTTEIVNNLGWRTLEQRRADARLCLFFKIVHGLVAVTLPDYIQPSNRISRNCHSMTFRLLHTTKNYYKYSFLPLAIVQRNALPETVACLPDLDSFKVSVSKLQHSKP